MCRSTIAITLVPCQPGNRTRGGTHLYGIDKENEIGLEAPQWAAKTLWCCSGFYHLHMRAQTDTIVQGTGYIHAGCIVTLQFVADPQNTCARKAALLNRPLHGDTQRVSPCSILRIWFLAHRTR